MTWEMSKELRECLEAAYKLDRILLRGLARAAVLKLDAEFQAEIDTADADALLDDMGIRHE